MLCVGDRQLFGKFGFEVASHGFPLGKGATDEQVASRGLGLQVYYRNGEKAQPVNVGVGGLRRSGCEQMLAFDVDEEVGRCAINDTVNFIEAVISAAPWIRDPGVMTAPVILVFKVAHEPELSAQGLNVLVGEQPDDVASIAAVHRDDHVKAFKITTRKLL